ncbi:hypothetical protein [Roseibium sp. SCP14]|uniref:hypothetical protein n=1 Tax=Roseibium sp. SCP14 TaxID=3141375 RepID=UPI00333730B4
MFGLTVRRATPSLRAGILLLVAMLIGPIVTSAFGEDLDRFNPATTDLDLFRIAVVHSDRLKIRASGPRMFFSMTDKTTGRVIREKTIYLQKAETAEEMSEDPSADSRKTISVYRIAARQVDELRALQARYLALTKAEQDQIAGSLAIDVSGCKIDPNDEGPMLISTFLKSSELQEYVTLAEDYDLRNIPMGTDGKTADPVQPCA